MLNFFTPTPYEISPHTYIPIIFHIEQRKTLSFVFDVYDEDEDGKYFRD